MPLNHSGKFSSLIFVATLLVGHSNIAFGQTLDTIAKLQTDAVNSKVSNWGHWGPNTEKYSSWTNHSNRLIPIYTFGINVRSVAGENSVYRDEKKITKLYGHLPENTLNPEARYFDQTDVFQLQQSAVASGKKRIILFVCDGMDWQSTQAAAIAKNGAVQYRSRRGTGLGFLDYKGSQKRGYGFFVTSPHNDGTTFDVNTQEVKTPGGKTQGGYNPMLGGKTPWAKAKDADYPIGKSEKNKHTFTDSAASATSMTCGIKTYNKAINVDITGNGMTPIARTLQQEGFAVGVVTSVPISHATPACAYSNNVTRNDYQDLTRDLIGRPSVFNPSQLPGVDVLIGCGWGVEKTKDGDQGKNFVAGNRYITEEDLAAIDVAHGGQYVVAQRTEGKAGLDVLSAGVEAAKENQHRLFGYFGVSEGHLPYQTADGNYDPVISVGNPDPKKAEVYTEADLAENVTLKNMALAAVDVLDSRSDQWWLMVECGDVDWANHANNIDNSIGAVLSGDQAFQGIVDWVENNGGWDDTALILTADHGHYFTLDNPGALIQPTTAKAASSD